MTTVKGYGGTYANWTNTSTTKAKRATRRTAKKNSRKKKELTIVGRNPSYPAYSIELEFSDDGDSFSNPLTTAKPDKDYFVRATITQHVGDPMWQGFKLSWLRPYGWAWADGLQGTTYEEANSNPIVVVRKVRSPKKLGKVTFRVGVSEKFR